MQKFGPPTKSVSILIKVFTYFFTSKINKICKNCRLYCALLYFCPNNVLWHCEMVVLQYFYFYNYKYIKYGWSLMPWCTCRQPEKYNSWLRRNKGEGVPEQSDWSCCIWWKMSGFVSARLQHCLNKLEGLTDRPEVEPNKALFLKYLKYLHNDVL